MMKLLLHIKFWKSENNLTFHKFITPVFIRTIRKTSRLKYLIFVFEKCISIRIVKRNSMFLKNILFIHLCIGVNKKVWSQVWKKKETKISEFFMKCLENFYLTPGKNLNFTLCTIFTIADTSKI